MCSGVRSSGSSGSPASASGAPAASCGGHRCEHVAPVEGRRDGSRRCGERATSTASTRAPEALDGQRQQAVVGADEDAVVLRRPHRDGAALAADLGVDDREVHAGREVGQCAAQHERAGAHVVAVIPWLTSMMRASGAIRAMTPWHTPTNSSSWP